ncbi:MAG: NAD(P)H-dependent glycerol-3-phosphate dehydrogenase [Eubacterium sp.]
MKEIGVLGAGTWGIALARMLANTNNDVTVWSAVERELEALSKSNIHPNLKGAVIPDSIAYTADMEEACREKDIIIFAVASVYVRSTAKRAAEYISDGQIVVDVAKGIEPDTLFTMSQIIDSEFKKYNPKSNISIVALSGPTHAEEVALDLPTTIVSACENIEAAQEVQNVFMNTCMRVYTNSDVKGVELCGALKNIIALAAGVSMGLGYGDNSNAAIITRGIAEISRLGMAMGCKMETFLGLAGIGDLIVTATSRHSRNNRAGYLIGQGLTPKEAVEEVGMVVEGINALPAAIKLAEKYGVEMPLVSMVNAVINHGVKPLDAVNRLMTRDKKPENI